MANYIPAVVWIIGALISYVVFRRRGVELSHLWNMVVVIAVTLAIPFAFVAKPNKVDTVH
jgi:hypothetical protein